MVRGTLWPIAGEKKAEEGGCRGSGEEEQEHREKAGGTGEGYCKGRSGIGEAVRGGEIVRARCIETGAERTVRWVHPGGRGIDILSACYQEVGGLTRS